MSRRVISEMVRSGRDGRGMTPIVAPAVNPPGMRERTARPSPAAFRAPGISVERPAPERVGSPTIAATPRRQRVTLRAVALDPVPQPLRDTGTHTFRLR